MTIKAISLWEPRATAMAWDLKRNETRSWPTAYKGALAICSAARKMTKDEVRTFDFIRSIQPAITAPTYGSVLCIVEIYDCVGTLSIQGISQWEARLGNYTPGRFAWRTRSVRKLREPLPIKGQQGLWELTPSVVAEIVSRL